MESTLGIIDRLALGGYIWLATILNTVWLYNFFIAGFALAGGIWAFVRPLPEGGADLLWQVLLWAVGAFIGLFLLYNPVTGSSLLSTLPQASPNTRSIAQQNAADGGVTMAAFYPTYLLERYFFAPVTEIALRATNRNSVAMVAKPTRAAARVISEPDVGSDPQYLAARSTWREVVAPAVLERTPTLREELLSKNQLADFYNPKSDLGPTDPLALLSSYHRGLKPHLRARLVAEQLDAKAANIDLKALFNEFEPLITDRMGGNQSWTVDATGSLVVPLLGPASSQATPPPPSPSDAAGLQAAYKLGLDVLNGVMNDTSRAPTVATVGDLYRAVGRSGDRAAAASILASGERITLFGATCQSLGEKYCALTLNGATDRSLEPHTGSFGESARRVAASAVGVAALALPAAIARVSEGLVSEAMPVVIGYMKFGLILVSICAPFMMMIPGMFAGSLQLVVGGHIFLALFTSFYIVWDRVTEGIFSNVGSSANYGEGGPFLIVMMSLLDLSGYSAIGVLAYMITFGALRSAQTMLRGVGAGNALNTSVVVAGGAKALKAIFK